MISIGITIILCLWFICMSLEDIKIELRYRNSLLKEQNNILTEVTNNVSSKIN
jgi:hypothetical protein